jgi:hypothetical protein
VKAVESRHFAPPSTMHLMLGKALDEVMFRALSTDRAWRYPRAADFAKELKKAVSSFMWRQDARAEFMSQRFEGRLAQEKALTAHLEERRTRTASVELPEVVEASAPGPIEPAPKRVEVPVTVAAPRASKRKKLKVTPRWPTPVAGLVGLVLGLGGATLGGTPSEAPRPRAGPGLRRLRARAARLRRPAHERPAGGDGVHRRASAHPAPGGEGHAESRQGSLSRPKRSAGAGMAAQRHPPPLSVGGWRQSSVESSLASSRITPCSNRLRGTTRRPSAPPRRVVSAWHPMAHLRRRWQSGPDASRRQSGRRVARGSTLFCMFGEMLDTSPAQRATYYARLRALTLVERAAMLSRLCRGVRALAEAGIRHSQPGLLDHEVRRELTVRLYGEAVAQRLLGSSPR